MTPETFCEQFATFAEAPNGVAKLRELILQLAVQGKLGTQDVNDELASVLADRIEAERARRIKACELRDSADERGVDESILPFALPPTWTWVRLGRIMQKMGAGSTPLGGKKVYVDDGVIFLRSQNVWDDGLVLDDVARITPEVHQDMSGTWVEPGDVLLNITGASIGRSALVPDDFGEANVSQHVAILRLIDKDVRQFLHLCVISPFFQATIMRVQVGVSREGLSMTRLREFPIPLPPLSEQRRIVGKVDQLLGLCDELAARQAARREARERLVGATLDRLVSASWDRLPACLPAAKQSRGIRQQPPSTPAHTDKRTLNESADTRQAGSLSHAHRLCDHFDRLFDTPTTLPQLRQAILQLAVQGQLVPQDPNDEPADELLERARMECVDTSDDGEAIDDAMDSTNESDELQLEQPASWKLIRFADIISYGPRNGISPKPVQHVTKTKSLTLSATTSGTFDGRHVKYLTEEFPADSFLWLKDGDILIQRSNSEHYVGAAAIYRGEPNDFVYPDLMMKVRVASCIDVAFAHLILMSPPSRAYFRTRATGTSGSMRKINKTTVKMLPFPLPPLSEQKRIVSKVTELLSLCDALEDKMTQAESASTQLLAAAVAMAQE
ncbi:MAG: restriction endonuclease subunit S [Planctomycetales bacterium]|nr:restriction endonuclease subunit S [Planctomycetales bacterium]